MGRGWEEDGAGRLGARQATCSRVLDTIQAATPQICPTKPYGSDKSLQKARPALI